MAATAATPGGASTAGRSGGSRNRLPLAPLADESTGGHEFPDFFAVARRAAGFFFTHDQAFEFFIAGFAMVFINRHIRILHFS